MFISIANLAQKPHMAQYPRGSRDEAHTSKFRGRTLKRMPGMCKNKTEKAMLRLRYLKGYGVNRLFNKDVMLFASSRNKIRQNIEKYDLFSKYSLQIAPPGMVTFVMIPS
jgi:hypothetical protein